MLMLKQHLKHNSCVHEPTAWKAKKTEEMIWRREQPLKLNDVQKCTVDVAVPVKNEVGIHIVSFPFKKHK